MCINTSGNSTLDPLESLMKQGVHCCHIEVIVTYVGWCFDRYIVFIEVQG